jgi:hypothetical protein
VALRGQEEQLYDPQPWSKIIEADQAVAGPRGASSSSAEGKDNDNGLLLLFLVALGAVVVFSMFHNEYYIVLYAGSHSTR